MVGVASVAKDRASGAKVPGLNLPLILGSEVALSQKNHSALETWCM